MASGGVYEQPATGGAHDRQRSTVYRQGRNVRLAEFDDRREHRPDFSGDVRHVLFLAAVSDTGASPGANHD